MEGRLVMRVRYVSTDDAALRLGYLKVSIACTMLKRRLPVVYEDIVLLRNGKALIIM